MKQALIIDPSPTICHCEKAAKPTKQSSIPAGLWASLWIASPCFRRFRNDAQKCFLTFIIATMMLTGCHEVTEPFPPFERENHITIRDHQDTRFLTLEAVAGNRSSLKKAVSSIAANYRHRGEGMIHVTVSASPGAAEQAGNVVTSALRGAGIARNDILVTKVDAQPRGVTLGYRALDVLEPDCADLPIGDAPMGCAMDRQLAKMVVRPADLLGRDRLDPMTSRRAADAVQRYDTFQPPVTIQNPLVPTTNAGATEQ